MKTVTQIIEAYKRKGHKVDGLFLNSVQTLGEEKMLQILLDANGRDIVVKEPGSDIIDGQTYEYIGKEDPKFDWESYFL
jgi:ribulose kinase